MNHEPFWLDPCSHPARLQITPNPRNGADDVEPRAPLRGHAYCRSCAKNNGTWRALERQWMNPNSLPLEQDQNTCRNCEDPLDYDQARKA
jgi:hypothetical protein